VLAATVIIVSVAGGRRDAGAGNDAGERYDIDAVSLYDQFRADRERFRERWVGKTVVVRGVVARTVFHLQAVFVNLNHQRDTRRFTQDKVVVVFQRRSGRDFGGFDVKATDNFRSLTVPWAKGRPSSCAAKSSSA
jgi:hypothetical protein